MKFLKQYQKSIHWILLGLLIMSLIFIWFQVFYRAHAEGVLTVSFLDVGQGDAIYIESPIGFQVLIDGGPNKKVLRELGDRMSFWDRSIDMIIASHPDLDHIGGLPAVFDRFDVDYYMKSDVLSDTEEYDALEKRAQKEAEVLLARRGQLIQLGGGAYLEVLFPDRSTERFDANLASVIVKIVYGENSFLLTGDAPKSIEKYLANSYGERLRVDVLKLGHHGSKTSTSDELLGVAVPEIAIISAEENSRYGHPHKEVLDRLDRFGIPYLETRIEGSITFESDGITLTRK